MRCVGDHAHVRGQTAASTDVCQPLDRGVAVKPRSRDNFKPVVFDRFHAGGDTHDRAARRHDVGAAGVASERVQHTGLRVCLATFWKKRGGSAIGETMGAVA